MLKSASSQNFLYWGVLLFSLNELCSATSVLLIAVVTCVMVEGISSLTQFKFGSGKEALLSLVHIHVPPVAL